MTTTDKSAEVGKAVMIPTADLSPNDYNPNKMTESEFEELVEEVRHLGRLPKPIVVRPGGTGFVIVDGEHNWKAAKQAGLKAVACEIIEADDFEAKRQTYKRNQHGTHDKVRLGQMFQQMKELRDLSNRALADEVHVSEGTIRNALLYAEAASLRNDYAFEDMPLADLRFYLQVLPRALRDGWLNSKSTVKDVMKATGYCSGGIWIAADDEIAIWHHSYGSFDRWAKKGLVVDRKRCHVPRTFIEECRHVSRYGFWWDRRTKRIDNLMAYVLRVVKHRRNGSPDYLDHLPLGEAADGKPSPVLMTPDEWGDLLDRAFKGAKTQHDVKRGLKAGTRAMLLKKGIAEDMTKPENELKLQELKKGAAWFIQSAPLPLEDQYELFKLTAEGLDEKGIKEAKKLTIAAVVEDGTRDLNQAFEKAVIQVQMAQAAVQPEDRKVDDDVKQKGEAVSEWIEQCPVRLVEADVTVLVHYLGCVDKRNYLAVLEWRKKMLLMGAAR